MNTNIRDLPFFCIVGRARSGTTLLRMLLDGHPEAIIPPECAFVQHLYSKFGRTKIWDEATVKSFIKCLHVEPAYDQLHVNDEKLMHDILEAGSDSTYADVCKLVYINSRSVFDKTCIRIAGDKNPAYSLFLEGLFTIFPSIRFIHITRDYRDHILSMKQVDFESGITASLACRWKFYNDRINAFKAMHPEKFLTLRYEDLVRDTASHLKTICRFLNLEYSDKLMDYTAKKEAYYDLYPGEALNKYHGSLFRPITEVPVNRWKQKMRTFDVQIADLVTGTSAEENGYERVYRKFNVAVWLYALPGRIYGRSYFYWGAFINALPWKLRMAVIHGMASVFRPYWKRYPVGGKR